MSTPVLPWEKYSAQAPPWQAHAPITQSPAETSPAAEAPSFMGTLGREVSSLASGVAGIPSALYHAAADPATAEEKARLGPEGMKQIGPLGRIIERSAIEPIRTAGDWYYKAAKGEIPNAYEQALSVAPEAIGAGAAVPVAGKIMQSAASAPGAIRSAVTSPAVRAGASELAPAMIRRIPYAGKVASDVFNAARAARTGAESPVYRDLTRQFTPYAGEDFGETSPNPAGMRPSVERIEGLRSSSPWDRIRGLPVAERTPDAAIRPSIERILPETAGAPGPVGRVLGEAEPDIDTEMRTGSPNPEPPPTPKPLETQIGTPEEEARIKQMMQGRSAKKLDLERGASTPEELTAVGTTAKTGAPAQLDARLAQVLDQLSREPQAAEAGPSAIERARARLGPPKKGTRIPGPEEDLTGLLNRSLKRVQSKRSQ